jgi:hypothetical protein
MTETVYRPDIGELIGVAVNSSRLDASPLCERAVDRIAGLGAAALEVSVGADLARLPIAAMAGDVYRDSVGMREVMLDPGTPDVRDQIAGELGPLLMHIFYGGQLGKLADASLLYARWLQTRRLFFSRVGPEHEPLLQRFARRVLYERIYNRCEFCGGTGRMEITRTGTLIRPRGNMMRNARFTTCRTKAGGGCHGTGHARPSHTVRTRLLEIDHATYEAERWAQRFNAAHAWLEFYFLARVKKALTRQLERSKNRI